MPIEKVLRRLDAANARVMQQQAAARFTPTCRSLLAVAFIPTDSVKLMDKRFASLGVNSSVGAFFGAMYQGRRCWRTCGCWRGTGRYGVRC